MSTLGSPLEALAFNYFSYGLLTAVNNVWTWVAVLTAAVSFWTIKTSSSLSPPSTPRCEPRARFPNASSNPPTPSRNSTFASPSPVERESVEPASTSKATTSFSPSEREGGLTKGKFTAYFDGEDGNVGGTENIFERIGDGEDDGRNVNGDVLVNGLGNEWYESWERVIKAKTGDAEWYRNQDLTVINGNVVRLWEGGCRRRSATALVTLGCVVSTW